MSGLNTQQSEASSHVEGPALVVAGAGSGKTRVLTLRIAKLIEEGHAFPAEILALTFTNKAAKEMRERVRTMLESVAPDVADDVFLSTFHSAGVRWLRKYGYVFNLPPHFTIFDDSDQNTLVKEVLKEMGQSEEEITPKFVLENFDRLKNDGINPSEHSFLEIRYPAHREKLKTIAKLYEKKKQLSSALDFGDLLLKTYELLEKHPEVREDLQKNFPYILVDEYQDTNAVQYKILKLLAEKNKNLFVVGDEDQSIYKWRGADIRNIREFERDYPNAKIYKLEQNYRSTQNILDVANAVISHNVQRREKELFTEGGEGELVQDHTFGTDFDEARWVVKKIAKLVRDGTCPSKIALLYRSHAISRQFEDSLRVERIPYIIYGGHKFYERAEIKDALSYLRLLINSRDEVAFFRIVNTPARGIGAASLEKVRDFARQEQVSHLEALSMMSSGQGEIAAGTRKKFQVFVKLIAELQEELRDSRLSDFYATLLDKSGYRKFLSDQNTVEAATKLDNLEELRNVLVDYETQNPEGGLEDFLQQTSLATDFDKANPELSVQMMTLHSSKGLEFPYVFLIGLEEGIFPSKMSLGFMSGEDEVDEERRLCYVGITRAEKQLFLTHAKVRRVYGRLQIQRPSRFLGEMPKHKLSLEDHSDDSTNRSWARYENTSDEKTYFSDSSSSQSDAHPWGDSFSQLGPDDIDDGYRVGSAVEHPDFGRGVIRARSGVGDATKVQIEFKGFGTRKFLTKFAKLRVLENNGSH
ncbi:MAG: UvrD-helicase domain-containing protein [Bdellovibrionota bacterium]